MYKKNIKKKNWFHFLSRWEESTSHLVPRQLSPFERSHFPVPVELLKDPSRILTIGPGSTEHFALCSSANFRGSNEKFEGEKNLRVSSILHPERDEQKEQFEVNFPPFSPTFYSSNDGDMPLLAIWALSPNFISFVPIFFLLLFFFSKWIISFSSYSQLHLFTLRCPLAKCCTFCSVNFGLLV